MHMNQKYTDTYIYIYISPYILTGSRLVNLKVTYQNKGITGICGFYPGLLSREGDIILFYCLPEAYATSVKLQIQSKAEQTNILNLCEVEFYKKT